MRQQTFGPTRQHQIAFKDDALVLFVNTFDAVARISCVAIGFGHQPADLVLSGVRCAKNHSDPVPMVRGMHIREILAHTNWPTQVCSRVNS